MMLALFVLLLSAIAQVGGRVQLSSQAVAQSDTREIRLLDAAGNPIPQGTRIEVRVEFFLDPTAPPPVFFAARNAMPFAPQVVGPGGKFSWTAMRNVPKHYRAVLQVRLSDSSGVSRVDADWPLKDASTSATDLVLVPEQVLCSGKIVDDLGSAVAFDSVHVEVTGALATDSVRVFGTDDGSFSVLGWPSKGPWKISALYMFHGPASTSQSFEVGQHDFDLVMPATGCVQVRVDLPEPFPAEGLAAVYQHVTSGEVARQPILYNVINHRLRVGSQRMRIELDGQTILDLGEVEVPHNDQHDVAVHLPDTVHVWTISVLTSDGKPVPTLRAHIEGAGPKRELNYNFDKGVLLVVTTRPSADLVFEAYGFRPLRVAGVSGDRRVELEKL